jgi:hypothetical protein
MGDPSFYSCFTKDKRKLIPPINGNEIVRFNCFFTKTAGDDIIHGDEFVIILGEIE